MPYRTDFRVLKNSFYATLHFLQIYSSEWQLSHIFAIRAAWGYVSRRHSYDFYLIEDHSQSSLAHDPSSAASVLNVLPKTIGNIHVRNPRRLTFYYSKNGTYIVDNRLLQKSAYYVWNAYGEDFLTQQRNMNATIIQDSYSRVKQNEPLNTQNAGVHLVRSKELAQLNWNHPQARADFERALLLHAVQAKHALYFPERTRYNNLKYGIKLGLLTLALPFTLVLTLIWDIGTLFFSLLGIAIDLVGYTGTFLKPHAVNICNKMAGAIRSKICGKKIPPVISPNPGQVIQPAPTLPINAQHSAGHPSATTTDTLQKTKSLTDAELESIELYVTHQCIHSWLSADCFQDIFKKDTLYTQAHVLAILQNLKSDNEGFVKNVFNWNDTHFEEIKRQAIALRTLISTELRSLKTSEMELDACLENNIELILRAIRNPKDYASWESMSAPTVQTPLFKSSEFDGRLKNTLEQGLNIESPGSERTAARRLQMA